MLCGKVVVDHPQTASPPCATRNVGRASLPESACPGNEVSCLWLARQPRVGFLHFPHLLALSSFIGNLHFSARVPLIAHFSSPQSSRNPFPRHTVSSTPLFSSACEIFRTNMALC